MISTSGVGYVLAMNVFGAITAHTGSSSLFCSLRVVYISFSEPLRPTTIQGHCKIPKNYNYALLIYLCPCLRGFGLGPCGARAGGSLGTSPGIVVQLATWRWWHSGKCSPIPDDQLADLYRPTPSSRAFRPSAVSPTSSAFETRTQNTILPSLVRRACGLSRMEAD